MRPLARLLAEMLLFLSLLLLGGTAIMAAGIAVYAIRALFTR